MPNEVTVKVTADTKNATSNLGKFTGKVKSAMPAISAISGGLALGAAAAVKLGDEMKMASRTIAAGTGASGTDLTDLEKSFTNVFKNVPNDSAEVAQAIADLNTEFGLTGTELETTATQMLNASRVMGVDLGSSIKTVADGMQIFGVDASEMGSTMDALAAASQATGVPIGQLASQVQTFGPVLKNAGFSMDEATAFFGSLEQNGIDVTRVMPGINAAMRKLSEEGVVDLKGAMEDQMVAIKGATTDAQALNIATDAFGAEGAQRMTVAIRNGNLDLGALLETMEGGEGTINNLAATTETTADKFAKMKNNVKANLAPVGEFAGAIGPMVVMLPALISGISGVSAVMGALNLSMGPVLIAIVAIAAAIGLGILIWKNWDTIVETFWNTVETLKETWDVVWNKIKSVFDTVVGALSRVFNSKLGWLLPGGALLKAFILIKDNWRSMWDGMKDIITRVVGSIKGAINSIIDTINAVLEGFNKIKIEIPSWSPVMGGKTLGFNVPLIPRLAKGGIVTGPTLAMLGESGSEAVIPLNKAGGGMGGINVTIVGDVYGFDDFEDKVSEAVRDGARRGGFQGILNTA